MRRCAECGVDIEGPWVRCPLCEAPLEGTAVPSPLPSIPLASPRPRTARTLIPAASALVLLSIAARLTFADRFGGAEQAPDVGASAGMMGLAALLIVPTHERPRAAARLVLAIIVMCVLWDHLTGWHGWSLTYVVPIVGASAIVAVMVWVRTRRVEFGDHVLYSAGAVLLGFVPIVFLAIGWVSAPLPSAASGALAVAAAVRLHVPRRAQVHRELAKRLRL